MSLRDWLEGPRAWLANQSERERNLVMAGGAVAALALLYLVLVLPLQTLAGRREARVEQKAADLAWMRQAAPAVAAASANGSAGARTGESLVVLVDRTAREAGLGAALRDQSPDGESGLRLRLEAAAFDTLIEWLGSLQERHGVSIDAVNFDATGTAGLVNASVTLMHAAPATAS